MGRSQRGSQPRHGICLTQHERACCQIHHTRIGEGGGADRERLPTGVGVDRAGVDDAVAYPVLGQGSVALQGDAAINLERLAVAGPVVNSTAGAIDRRCACCGQMMHRSSSGGSACRARASVITIEIPDAGSLVDNHAIDQRQIVIDVDISIHSQITGNSDSIKFAHPSITGIEYSAVIADQSAVFDDASQQT